MGSSCHISNCRAYYLGDCIVSNIVLGIFLLAFNVTLGLVNELTWWTVLGVGISMFFIGYGLKGVVNRTLGL